MSSKNIHYHDRKDTFPKISVSIFFLELSEEFPRDKNEFDSFTVNKPSVFVTKKCLYDVNPIKPHF